MVHCVGHAEPPGKPLAPAQSPKEDRPEGRGCAEVKVDHCEAAVGKEVIVLAAVQEEKALAALDQSPPVAQ